MSNYCSNCNLSGSATNNSGPVGSRSHENWCGNEVNDFHLYINRYNPIYGLYGTRYSQSYNNSLPSNGNQSYGHLCGDQLNTIYSDSYSNLYCDSYGNSYFDTTDNTGNNNNYNSNNTNNSNNSSNNNISCISNNNYNSNNNSNSNNTNSGSNTWRGSSNSCGICDTFGSTQDFVLENNSGEIFEEGSFSHNRSNRSFKHNHKNSGSNFYKRYDAKKIRKTKSAMENSERKLRNGTCLMKNELPQEEVPGNSVPNYEQGIKEGGTNVVKNTQEEMNTGNSSGNTSGSSLNKKNNRKSVHKNSNKGTNKNTNGGVNGTTQGGNADINKGIVTGDSATKKKKHMVTRSTETICCPATHPAQMNSNETIDIENVVDESGSCTVGGKKDIKNVTVKEEFGRTDSVKKEGPIKEFDKKDGVKKVETSVKTNSTSNKGCSKSANTKGSANDGRPERNKENNASGSNNGNSNNGNSNGSNNININNGSNANNNNSHNNSNNNNNNNTNNGVKPRGACEGNKPSDGNANQGSGRKNNDNDRRNKHETNGRKNAETAQRGNTTVGTIASTRMDGSQTVSTTTATGTNGNPVLNATSSRNRNSNGDRSSARNVDERRKPFNQNNSSSLFAQGNQTNRSSHTNANGSGNSSTGNANSNNANNGSADSKSRVVNEGAGNSSDTNRNGADANAVGDNTNSSNTAANSGSYVSDSFNDSTNDGQRNPYDILWGRNTNMYMPQRRFLTSLNMPTSTHMESVTTRPPFDMLNPVETVFNAGINAAINATNGTSRVVNSSVAKNRENGAVNSHTSSNNSINVNNSNTYDAIYSNRRDLLSGNSNTNPRRSSGNTDNARNSNSFRSNRSFHSQGSGPNGIPMNSMYNGSNGFSGVGGLNSNNVFGSGNSFGFAAGGYGTSGGFNQGGTESVTGNIFGHDSVFSFGGSMNTFSQPSVHHGGSTHFGNGSSSPSNTNASNYSNGVYNNSSRTKRSTVANNTVGTNTMGGTGTVGGSSSMSGIGGVEGVGAVAGTTGGNTTTQQNDMVNGNDGTELDTPSGLDNPDGPTGVLGNDYDNQQEMRHGQHENNGNSFNNFSYGKNSGNKRNYVFSGGNGNNNGHNNNSHGSGRGYGHGHSSNGHGSSFEKNKNCEGVHGCNNNNNNNNNSSNNSNNNNNGSEREKKQYIEGLNMEDRKKEAEKYRRLGNQSYKLGFFQSAIDYYTKAIEFDNTNHVYYTNRALCYKKQKLWKQANSDARQALNLEEDSVKAHFILGLTLLHLNSLEEGLKKLTKAKTLSSYLKDSNESEINRYILQAKKLIYLRDEQAKQIMYAELKSFLTDKINTLYASGDITESEKNLRISQTETLFNDALQSTQDKTVPDYLCCKISMCLMNEPVITPSGMTYDRIFLTEHVKHNGPYDPVSRQAFAIKDVIPNYAIKEATEQFLKANPWAFEE